MKNSQRVVIIGGEFSGFSLENLLGGGSDGFGQRSELTRTLQLVQNWMRLLPMSMVE